MLAEYELSNGQEREVAKLNAEVLLDIRDNLSNLTNVLSQLQYNTQAIPQEMHSIGRIMDEMKHYAVHQVDESKNIVSSLGKIQHELSAGNEFKKPIPKTPSKLWSFLTREIKWTSSLTIKEK